MPISRAILVCSLFPCLLTAQSTETTSWMSMQGASNIALSLRGSYQFASLDEWRQQFAPPPPAMMTGIGLEATYDPGSFLMLGAGYEYFFGQKVKDRLSGVEDQVTAGFLYGSLRAGIYLDERKAFFLFGGADVGPISLKETAKVNGIEYEATGSKLAVRPKAGIMVFFNPRLSSTFDVGYMVGKISGVKFPGNVVASTYDLSGLYLGAILNYHFPL